MTSQYMRLLLVDDDPSDVELVRESLKTSKLLVEINHVSDGHECMEYLRQVGKYSSAKTPDVIFLDLNMPKKDGRQVLKEMKSDELLKQIPVVILTTSDAEVDIVKSYKLGANCYVTKPVDFNQIQKVVNEIAEFWFTVVKLPDGKG